MGGPSKLGAAFLAGLLAALLALAPAAGPRAAPRHGIAMHGAPALPEDARHFPHADPDAPKGGTLVEGRTGTFDSFNPFTLKGSPAKGLDLVFESLLERSPDEPFTLYAQIAESVETPPDRSWVEFTLDPRARFQDGTPVTVDDVVFSLEILRDKGRPNYRTYYANVARIERPGPRRVRFVFAPGTNQELPLILGLMPVLPKARYQGERFEAASLEPPLGSGPYRLDRVDPGRSVGYVRDPDYWGRDLPVNRGRYNFERVRYDYFRDRGIAFEAFKKGLIDIWFEPAPERWARNYDFPAVRQGRVRREEIEHGRAMGMYGFALNTRRARFADRRVRKALMLAFDFDWVNKVYFHGIYRRMTSFFENSELAAKGPATAAERELLARFPGSVDPEILDRGFVPPESDGDGTNRANLLAAAELLRQAGWRIEGLKLIDGVSGEPFVFEILLNRPEDERIALAYRRWLERLGIEASVRTVDTAQYIQRIETYDFDAIINRWGASLSPGNEQHFYWGSRGAELQGTRNYPGIKSAAVDALIEDITAARTREALTAAVRALDRVLLSGYYVVPLYYLPLDYVAYWARLARPERAPLYGVDLTTWWERRP